MPRKEKTEARLRSHHRDRAEAALLLLRSETSASRHSSLHSVSFFVFRTCKLSRKIWTEGKVRCGTTSQANQYSGAVQHMQR